jgi:hypothetical protein
MPIIWALSYRLNLKLCIFEFVFLWQSTSFCSYKRKLLKHTFLRKQLKLFLHQKAHKTNNWWYKCK